MLNDDHRVAHQFCGADENSSTIVPQDAECAIEIPQIEVENSGIDIILSAAAECAAQVDNPTFELENEIEVGLDTVEVWATTSITSDTSIDFSLVLPTVECSAETDDPTLIIDPPGPGEDIDIILDAAEVATEIDEFWLTAGVTAGFASGSASTAACCVFGAAAFLETCTLGEDLRRTTLWRFLR